MSFQKFSHFGKRNSSFISITSSQSFGFGGDFLEKNGLLDKKYILLFFDSEENKIGFKFKSQREENDGSFKIIENKGTNSRSVVCRSFFTTFLDNINLDEYQSKYSPEMINDSDYGTLFAIKLKKKQQTS